MPKQKHSFFILALLLAVLSTSCLKSKKPGIPNEVINTLNESDIRKPDLLKVILTFQQPEDSLKLQSAYFLIQNLDNNYSIKMSLYDSSDNLIQINIEDFADYTTIKEYRDSLEKISGKLSYKADSIWLDIDTLKSEFLINHINTAFTTMQNNTWSTKYDFNTFCNYILPYRVANEEIEPSINFFQTKYAHLIQQNLSIVDLATLLNSEINNELSYDERLVINPNVQSVAILEETYAGNLLDLNVYKVNALRSMGIAAALDYTPFFADSILGFYSTTVLLPDNNKLILLHSDDHATPYQQGKVAKVYRRLHRNDPESLFSIKDKKTHTPPFLGNYNYLDVTNEYLQTADISIDCADTLQFIYLAILNENKWKPVEWAQVESDGNAIFSDMATGVYYKPVIVLEEEIVVVGEGFYAK